MVGKKGHYTYLLSDGCCWNTSYLALVSFQEEGVDSQLSPVDFETTPAAPQTDVPTPPARPVRLRRPPEWTKVFLQGLKTLNDVIDAKCKG